MARVAAIDCGTNSIRLLIADVAADGASLTDVVRVMKVVRLGQGVDRTGQFAPEALERTLEATSEYAALCREHGVEAVRFVATSATRDASNRQEFIDGVKERLGVEPEVISGNEEAALSFRGAVSVVADDLTPPYLVVDLGGGSTELVLGENGPAGSHSMDVGCVRMTERHFADGADGADHIADAAPSVERFDAAAADVRAALDMALADVPVAQTRTLVGLAGTITTVTAHALGLAEYDREAINGARLSVDEALASCNAILAASRSEREAMPFMHPGRVDVISAGALVWREVVTRVRDEVASAGGKLEEVVTSEHDILDGIAFSTVARI
ncbi:Ppx/GppA phosphatase family protein [Demequina sediminicola]|uniref:Ppx/GppA phosphatase family protein n=1 Tax=Demequina sediminicola TaxID=1095026 RepID=UPI0007847932|nr:Ppx/GppA phosphatase family protein [Demequina sediminicola]